MAQEADVNIAEDFVTTKPGEKRPRYLRCTARRYFNGPEKENEATGKRKLVEPGDDVVLLYDQAVRLAQGTNPKVVVGKEKREAAKKIAAKKKAQREAREKETAALAKRRRELVGG